MRDTSRALGGGMSITGGGGLGLGKPVSWEIISALSAPFKPWRLRPSSRTRHDLPSPIQFLIYFNYSPPCTPHHNPLSPQALLIE